MNFSERELKEAIHDLHKAEGLELDSKSGWQDVLRRAAERPPSSWKYYLVSAAGVLVFLLFLGWTTVSSSWTFSVWHQTDSWFGKSLHGLSTIFTGKHANTSTPQITDLDTPLVLEFSNLDEANTESPFQILVPSWIPSGYVLITVEITMFTRESAEIALVYTGHSATFEIIQRREEGDIGLGEMYDSDDSSTQDVVVGAKTGVFITHKTGYSVLQWHNRGYLFVIRGLLPQTEMIRIAESIPNP